MAQPVLTINPEDKSREELIPLLINRFVESRINGENSCTTPVLSWNGEEVVGVVKIKEFLTRVPPGMP